MQIKNGEAVTYRAKHKMSFKYYEEENELGCSRVRLEARRERSLRADKGLNRIDNMILSIK